MKKILLFTTLLFVSTYLLAEQDTGLSADTRKSDVLITTSGDSINCNIFAISDTEVKYRMDGYQIDFTTNLKNIASILFHNGTTKIYHKQKEKIEYKYNPQPFDQNKYKFGFSVGYEMQLLSYVNGGWARLFGYMNNKQSNGLKVGFIANPEFKYGIGLKTGLDANFSFSNMNPILFGFCFSLDIPVQLSYRYQIIKNWSV